MCVHELVIIGNGFDIAHGLPTRYADFKNYLLEDERRPDFFSEDKWQSFNGLLFCDSTKHSFYEELIRYIPEEALWSSFEEALAEIEVGQIQEDNSCYLLGYGADDWHDSAHHDFQNAIDDTLSFAPSIPDYFSQWVSRINTRADQEISSDIINDDCIFLTFNYTDTLESSYGISPEHILYIHGKVLRGDKPILGHHRSELFQGEPAPQFRSEEERELYYMNYVDDVRILKAEEIFKEYFKRTYKDTASIILQNQAFFRSLQSVDEVYVFGHSLSEIDFGYFNEIRKNVSDSCKWNISYHSCKDFCNAQKFVSNLGIRGFHLFHF